MNTRPNILIIIALPIASTLATGCEKKEEAKPATQVVARVNSEEITVHQLNNILARNPNITPEAAAQAKREVLDRLIDQHLARQKAIESQLDRSPGVMQTIEAARTEILARAYLEQVAAAIPRTADWEIQKYYKEHPELFAQRRIFTLEEIAFAAGSGAAADLRAQLPRARSMQEAADWLESRGIKFAVNRGVRAAEQIPLEILPSLHAMKEGQIQLFEVTGDRFQLIRLIGYRVEPVDEATATPRIQQFLWNRRTSELVAKEMKKIKEQAKIEYVGEFAQGEAKGDPANAATTGPATTNLEKSGK